MFLFTFILIILKELTCDTVVSSEKDYVQKERTDKHVANSDAKHRRFLQDLSDDEWHVAHLKDTDFSRRSDCGDTFEDQARRYRERLSNDGSLVQFVSADPIPFKESDLDKIDKCKAPSNYTIFFKYAKPRDERNTTLNPGNEEKNNVHKKSFENGTIEREIYPATTANIKEALGKDNKAQNKTNSRRASEYQFSSIEYYDEVIEFDEHMCPNAIEVIPLDIDQLRSYDIECEQVLEWRSLE